MSLGFLYLSQCRKCGSLATREAAKKGGKGVMIPALGARLLPGGVPANHGVGNRIGRSEIWLDVEEGGLVEAVEPHDRKLRTLDAQEAHHAHGDRVGSGRRAQRKRAPPHAVV